MAYGIDGRLQLAAGTWSSWESLDIASTGIANSPAVAINSDGRLEVFVIGSGDNGLWHRRQTAPSSSSDMVRLGIIGYSKYLE